MSQGAVVTGTTPGPASPSAPLALLRLVATVALNPPLPPRPDLVAALALRVTRGRGKDVPALRSNVYNLVHL